MLLNQGPTPAVDEVVEVVIGAPVQRRVVDAVLVVVQHADDLALRAVGDQAGGRAVDGRAVRMRLRQRRGQRDAGARAAVSTTRAVARCACVSARSA